MLDAENPAENTNPSVSDPGEGEDTAKGAGAAPVKKAAAKRTAAKKATAKKTVAKKATVKKATTKRVAKKVAETAEGTEALAASAEPTGAGPETGSETAAVTTPAPAAAGPESVAEEGPPAAGEAPPAKKPAKKAAKKATAKRATKKAAAPEPTREAAEGAPEAAEVAGATVPESTEEAPQTAGPAPATALLFQAPDPNKAVVTRRRRATRPEAPAVPGTEETTSAEGAGEERPRAERAPKKSAKKPAKAKLDEGGEAAEAEQPVDEAGHETTGGEGEEEQGGERRRRRRGGRRRRRSGGGEDNGSAEGSEGPEGAAEETSEQAAEAEEGEDASATGSRRRRRRRRSGEAGDGAGEEAEGTVTRVRKPRNAEDEITAVTGSTRLEAKKQRRREGREAGRRRAPIVSEAEFLARRESVDRVMVIRQRQDLTQIAVLEDKVLVEHYVARESQTSLIGNVYLGRVQNVLPSMEAAFIDIGKGRNAVLYAGEVNWDALGAKNGSPRKIEAVLKSGQTVLVQVTKDPIGHKGARLTSQISLPGRFLVYVPDGTTSGISRKLPDTERNRLKNLLKDIVPDTAGVIVRTAAEGASEDELTRDVERLTARWSDIEKKAAAGNAPQLLYGEPDLTLKVVRDLFTEDFSKLVIAGDDAWDMVEAYVSHVAPDLAERLERYDGQRDVFAEYRIDEQIDKALDRKVWLPSGGSLVIDRTEAMTVVDVNTGKFTGSGGNLEETVTKNNLEAAEEIVRQLRLRDIGGIIVVDFIDMVLESNRDLVLRRLVECLGRDRTRHQVAEVTSLGLVQMTRKRIGTGLLEAFSESCEHCSGRGLVLHHEPVEPKKKADEESRRGRRGGRGRGREEAAASANGGGGAVPSPKDIAAMAKHGEAPEEEAAGRPSDEAAQVEQEVASATPDGTGSETAQTRAEGRTRGGRGRGRGRGAAAAEEVPQQEAPQQEASQAAVSEDTAPDGAGPKQTAPEEVASAAEASPLQETARSATPPESEQSELFPATQQPRAEERPAVAEQENRREQPDAETAPEGAEAPKGADGSQEAAAPSAPPAPRVVTTVRRRSARRPAGPPSGMAAQAMSGPATSVAVGEAGGEQDAHEPSDADSPATVVDAAEEPPGPDGRVADDAAPDVPTTPHVPVKKRGRRR